jgi:predicted porin
MRKLLLGSTGLFSAGLALGGLTGAAAAEEPIRLTVGGYFKSAYQIVVDDNENGEDGRSEPGYDRNIDGFFSDAEIHFVGRTTLDNGLEVGARVELEGETDNDQIDEAWVWFSGGFGEFRIGSDDEALANACIMPPGGTANFSAFSPNQWGANSIESNTVCTGVDAVSDAQKILYITPVFYGFQLTTSYTPSQFAENHFSEGGPHLGMPEKFEQTADYGVSAYLTYSYEGDGWGVTWGGGASFESGTNTEESGGTSIKVNDQDFYQTGLTVTIGNFAFGVAGQYMNDITNATLSDGNDSVKIEQDAWIAGGGIAYTHDAWIFGAQYSYREDDFTFFDFDLEHRQHRGVLTANYALGPGIDLDAEIAYTRADTNNLGNVLFGDDNYDALEIGFGSAITF